MWPVAIGVALALAGCAASLEELESARGLDRLALRASADLRCEPQSVDVAPVEHGAAVAAGCGVSALYAADCQDDEDGCVWKLDGPVSEPPPLYGWNRGERKLLSGDPGSPCGSDVDCGDGLTCREEQPGGMCRPM